MFKAYRDGNNISGLTDFCQFWLPTDWQPGAGTPMVLLAMGYGDDTSGLITHPEMDAFARAITDAGYGVVTSLYGGDSGFGNAATRTQVGVIADFVQTGDNSFGTPYVGAGKLVLVGFSMGGTTTLNWAGNLATPSDRVKGFVGVNALVDINYSAAASAVAAAYPSGVTNSTDDPTTMAQNGKYSGISCTVCYADNDTEVPYSTMQAFGTATSATAVDEGSTGHLWTNIGLSSVLSAIIGTCAA
ncbi:alpha/beta fold hydrolase [Gordonia sp. N1V]|uniref:alpha/beta hydrolase family protein n=1 Tax=Gordonia sp. N1V TaxID=3034163 RepID=UPI0023E25FC9|nr:alpha/beta fold hydrolase [Gordonia sp. N1V]MDF3280934.1 hypothetical protein [Gordonia sp. N1V]